MSRISKQDRAHMETAFHGPVSRRVLAALDAAEAAERDLRARLKAVRGQVSKNVSGALTRPTLLRITDLRVKNWRKP